MSITIDIKIGQWIWKRDDKRTGCFEFVRLSRNGFKMLFKSDNGDEEWMSEKRFHRLHDHGNLVFIDGNGGAPGEMRVFGPNEVWAKTDDPSVAQLTGKGRRAYAFQFYVVKYDEQGGGSLGVVSLQRLIDRWRPVAIQLGFESKVDRNGLDPDGKKPFRVQPARLKAAIQNCGVPGARPLDAFRKRNGGSRRRYDDIVENLLDEAVDFYWQKRGNSYNNAYAFFRVKIDAENKQRMTRGVEPLKFPDRLEVLRRRINKTVCYDNWARKYSKQESYRKFKGRKEHRTADLPLELVIMDHTKFDAWTVLDTKTYIPLGRPWLTLCIDVATRMILGYHLTFLEPSLYSVLITLKRVNKSKSYVKKLYPHISGTWDGFGRPTEVLIDNAWEFKAPSLQHSLKNLGIEITWAPVHTPQYKAIGERIFGTVNSMLAHRLKGGVPYNPYVLRQVKLDPKKDAVITLDDLDALIHEAIIFYIHKPHGGLGGIPARIWRDKIEIHKRHVISDVNLLDEVLGQVATGTLTPTGIRFKNMVFHDEKITSFLMDEILRFEAKRSQGSMPYSPGRVQVVFTYSPADAGKIRVWNHGGEPHGYYVSLPNKDSRFEGLAFWHWEEIMKFAKQRDIDFRSESERWRAADELRISWENFDRKAPLRETKDARRGVGFSQGTFDDDLEEKIDASVDLDLIVDAVAAPSTDGRSEPEGLPDEFVAAMLRRDNKPNKGRTPSKKTVAKAQATKKREKDLAEAAKAQADQRHRQGNPSGNPVTKAASRPNGAIEELLHGAGWDDEDKLDDRPSAAAPPLAVDEGRGEPLAAGDGWDD